jgi:thiol-disulfide isomerase/thioredoxin
MKLNHTLSALICLCAAQIAGAAELQWYGASSWDAMRQAHASRPWIVHLWGMSCDPCRAEMPAWGRFMHNHPGADVTFIEVEQATPSDVEAALTQAGLQGSDQWLSTNGFDVEERYAIDRRWGGEIPLTLLVSPDGHVQTIAGTLNFHQLDAWIDKQRRP